MTEVLDDGFHFIVSVEVDWESVGVEFLLEVWLERCDDKSSFEVGIRGEHIS